MAGSRGSAGSAVEFREARFYAQARANRHICSELGVQFSTNLRKSAWTPQGTPRHPRDPQGTSQGPPKGSPRDPQGTPNVPQGTQGQPKGAFKGVQGTLKTGSWAPPPSPLPLLLPLLLHLLQLPMLQLLPLRWGEGGERSARIYIIKFPNNRMRGRYVMI